jgi:tRNA nucleotidyltransferase (CCA-adding enzyme)
VNLLPLMREAPGAEPALGALEDEPAVHVVGGAVRDALLGRVPRELDFVVEGDAVPVARRAAQRLGGSVTVHERFGTATVRSADTAFDVVSARTETYARPGALPEVRPGATIEADLRRRDFAVNAIALHVADGRLTEYPGAREDLEEGVLRVLHDASFVDDPTRLLRLARYAARLGFEPDPGTDALAAEATLDTVSPSRLGAELRLLLREPQPAALGRLERYQLGARLLGTFAADERRIAEAIALCPADARADLAALAVCVGSEGLAERLDAFEFTAQERAATVEAAAAPALPEGLDDAELWRRLRRARPEAAAVAGARGSREAAERWLGDVRHRRLAITGDDLVAAGLSGPAVGAALDAATLAMLAGRASGRDEQLAAALRG